MLIFRALQGSRRGRCFDKMLHGYHSGHTEAV